jgi:hypothetical protein
MKIVDQSSLVGWLCCLEMVSSADEDDTKEAAWGEKERAFCRSIFGEPRSSKHFVDQTKVGNYKYVDKIHARYKIFKKFTNKKNFRQNFRRACETWRADQAASGQRRDGLGNKNDDGDVEMEETNASAGAATSELDGELNDGVDDDDDDEDFGGEPIACFVGAVDHSHSLSFFYFR